MVPPRQNLVFDTADAISCVNELPQLANVVSAAMDKFGFTSVGLGNLPLPGEGTEPTILMERVPVGFRELYSEERLYLTDHISAHARVVYEPFRYSEAPYAGIDAAGHRRFMEVLGMHELGSGLIVPIGRLNNLPACVWLGGRNSDLDGGATRALQLIALFAAERARALAYPPPKGHRVSPLTSHERDVLQWIAAGKTSWEIGVIYGLSERTINKLIGEAMVKLNAVTRAQAVVTAICNGDIEL